MDNSIIASGLVATSTRNTPDGTNSVSREETLLTTLPGDTVERNSDLPATSQILDINNPSDVDTNRGSRTEERTDPIAQQRQIESFLAEQTGEAPDTFQGIDIRTALDLQESFRNRSTQDPASNTAAQENTEQSIGTNEQQSLELQQRLQSRLAEQIPNDPGTEFPQLIETVA